MHSLKHEIEQVAYDVKIVDVDTYFYSEQRKSIATLKRNKFPNIYFVIWYCITRIISRILEPQIAVGIQKGVNSMHLWDMRREVF